MQVASYMHCLAGFIIDMPQTKSPGKMHMCRRADPLRGQLPKPNSVIPTFLARDVIYTSRTYAMMPVRLSVSLSVCL